MKSKRKLMESFFPLAQRCFLFGYLLLEGLVFNLARPQKIREPLVLIFQNAFALYGINMVKRKSSKYLEEGILVLIIFV